MKKYKGLIIVSSIVVLLPMLLGLILWNRLPDTMVTHWGAEGAADGAMGKAFAVFLIPVICLALHLICVFFTLMDKKNKEQNPKVVSICFWIIPIISLLCNGYIYAFALDSQFNMLMLGTMSFMGVVFILFGNYLPKCKPNHTIGIKVIWALRNEENWVKTHRFAGKTWVLAGVLFLLSLAVPGIVGMVVKAIAMLLLLSPVLYSYLYYRKQLKEGKITKEDMKQTKGDKVTKITHAVVGIIVLVAAIMLLVYGNFDVVMGEESLQIEASGWSDAEVIYAEIDRVEYVEVATDFTKTRDYGFGTPRITMGDCSNRELGKFTAYVYDSCDTYVAIYVGDKMMVLNRETAEETKLLYEELSEKIGR
ncbi:MAG: SdpI family protein [Lachnospiraceae bacterium]|nr:SdpI family protein [Lachnospiraceae bacterium]MBP3352913.1 SdpI family protein [Lachnospiraceae bacterium]